MPARHHLGLALRSHRLLKLRCLMQVSAICSHHNLSLPVL
ncbi:hypothetical protein GCK32_022594 [Trichostrongylus colubriformis]|uniref:Uncharacterized protein n=1 Tax=Trichostrongylus colubriformis TaxID=6319 RepID=A0AAN8FQF5_TRICO